MADEKEVQILKNCSDGAVNVTMRYHLGHISYSAKAARDLDTWQWLMNLLPLSIG